jgi:hypothetical protein
MSPEGDFCQPCVSTFSLGGFAEVHNTLRNFKQSLKTVTNLLDEFSAARAELIRKTNEGEIKSRVSKKDKKDLKAHDS